MDRFCTQCGKPLEEGMRFCIHCGFDTEGNQEPAASQYGIENDFDQKDQTADQNQYNQAGRITQDNEYIQKDGYDRHRESYSPFPSGSGTGKKGPIIIVLASLFLVLVLACVYFFILRDDPSNIVDPGIPPSPSQTETTEGVTETEGVKQQGLQGADYLPAPGMKLDYYERFIDGTEGPCTKYAARLSPKIPASEVHIFVDGNNEEFAWVSHYIQKKDGIYIVDDTSISENIKVLPAVIKEGDTWTREWPEGAMVMTVAAVGVNCELGFTTLKNCVVIHNDNQAVGFDVLQYYAPGMGLVKEESPDGNQVNMEVTACQLLNAEEAANIVGKHAFQVSQLEASIK